jgi:DHA1 family tetracycline resistance protein-like MFS transporter
LLWMLYPLTMLNMAISGFTFPTMTTLTTDCVPHHEVGLLMGVSTAVGSLMNIAGPLWAGVVYDAVMPGSPYWMGAFIFTAAALMLFARQGITTNGCVNYLTRLCHR